MSHSQAASGGGGNIPLVDRSALDPIMNVTGPAVMKAIVASFWDAADGMMSALDSAVASGDPEAIRRAAHTLKGAASNVGAGRAARIAAAMEQAEPQRAPALMALLNQTMQDTRPALDAVLNQAA